jgi:hypothetical protein
VKPQNDGNTEETLSFEEKMRRERLRDLSIGVTDYTWSDSTCVFKPVNFITDFLSIFLGFRSPNPAKPYILIPQQGNLYLQNGVAGELRLLVDKTVTGRSGPAVYAKVRRHTAFLTCFS